MVGLDERENDGDRFVRFDKKKILWFEISEANFPFWDCLKTNLQIEECIIYTCCTISCLLMGKHP